MVLLPGSNAIFNSNLENATAAVATLQNTTTTDQVPGTVKTSTTSDTSILAPLKLPMVFVATTLYPSLIPQISHSAHLKTIFSSTPVPQMVAPPIVSVTTDLVPLEQENLKKRFYPMQTKLCYQEY